MSYENINLPGGGSIQQWVSPPIAPVFTGYGTIITNLAFEKRFTDIERKAIRLAAKTDPDVEDAMGLSTKATYVDLARTDTQNLTLLFVSKGLLTAPRRLIILTTPVTDPLELPASVRASYGLPEIPV